ncbi:hypothetical protein G9E11_15090 [Arthrobacter sp. IA7]|uniref:hypothetical protein n=1 Tax=Arthrobacter ipis TaxID=2716202 RepID=UPI0016823048|nr:hypothetical protein [Arthrobacter ipis]MBD1543538.1 hypothetical protein [Arthrobacter ipis]
MPTASPSDERLRRQGRGSFYFPEEVRLGQWIHYVLVMKCRSNANANATSGIYVNGYTKMYRNGIPANQNDLNYRGTCIVPDRGSAPFPVGTGDFNSLFQKVL